MSRKPLFSQRLLAFALVLALGPAVALAADSGGAKSGSGSGSFTRTDTSGSTYSKTAAPSPGKDRSFCRAKPHREDASERARYFELLRAGIKGSYGSAKGDDRYQTEFDLDRDGTVSKSDLGWLYRTLAFDPIVDIGNLFNARGRKEALVLPVPFRDQEFERIEAVGDYNAPGVPLRDAFVSRDRLDDVVSVKERLDILSRGSFDFGAYIVNAYPAYNMHVDDSRYFGLRRAYNDLAWDAAGGRLFSDTMEFVRGNQALQDEIRRVGGLRRFDKDGDGMVDLLIIVVAGPAVPPEGGLARAQFSEVLGGVPGFDGYRFGPYVILNEPSANHPVTWSRVFARVASHEFMHSLGLPDMYPRQEGDALRGVGDWELMGDGDSLGAYSYLKLGWRSATRVEGDRHALVFDTDSRTDGAIYLLPTDDAGEYFLLEHKRNVFNGLTEHYPWANPPPAGSMGLFIWHVLEDEPSDHVTLVQADGRNDLNDRVNSGDNGDPFEPGDEWTADSDPSSVRHDGQRTGISVTNIERNFGWAGPLDVDLRVP